jgi:protein-S-isoprenylcysteine O-methyltransferase Ste14
MAGAAEPSGALLVPAGARDPARWVRLPPPVLAAALAFASLAAHAIVLGTEAPLGRSPLAGGAFAFAGAAWLLWAAWQFRQAGTAIRPTAQPTVLVEEGPYRFGRNPMYLGITLVLLGAAVALGVPTLALAAAAFALVVRRVHVPFEEARMQRTFGGWYSDYAARVRRWG